MKKLLSLITVILGLSSCQEFLEEQPKSQIATSEFFNSADDAYSAVNILYRKGFPTFYNTSINGAAVMMYGGFLSGYYDNQYKGEFLNRVQNLTVDSNLDNNELQNIWQSCYETIVRNANFAIKYIPGCAGLTDDERSLLIAEAKFFRALNYFYLVKMFGAVPLITDSYESLDNMYIKRSSEEKIYNLIIADLEEALKSSSLKDKPMHENGFRISRGSVQALLSDVYLNVAGYPVKNEAMYAKAAENAIRLISSSSYGLINNGDMKANSAYSILRTSDTEKEYLYTIEHDALIAPGSGYTMFCFPQEASSWGEFPKYVMCNLGYDPLMTLHHAYKTDDLRYQEQQYFHSKYTQVNGRFAGTVRTFSKPIPYFWWEAQAAQVTGISPKDRVHYRLAEMYLIAAEGLVKSQKSVSPEAATYLATIKHRASMTQTKEQITAELMVLTPDAFVAEVWREKIREFIFENKIWNDITRTRMYPVSTDGKTLTFSPLIGAKNSFGGTYSEKNIYLPICVQELQRNPALADAPL
jgi:hypothetical protein